MLRKTTPLCMTASRLKYNTLQNCNFVLGRILFCSVVMVLAFGARCHWFESCPDLILLPCIYSFVSLLRTSFVRTRSNTTNLPAFALKKDLVIFWNENVDSVDLRSESTFCIRHQNARFVQSDLDLHSPQKFLLSSIVIMLRHIWSVF